MLIKVFCHLQICHSYCLQQIDEKQIIQDKQIIIPEKGKKAFWSQLLKITLKLQITEVIVSYLILVLAHGVTDCFETLSVQGQKRVLMSFTPLFLREQDNSQLSAQYYNQTPRLGLEQESARYGNLKKGLMQFSVKYQ